MELKPGTAEYLEEANRLHVLVNQGKKDDFSAEEHLFYRDYLLEQWECSKIALEIAKNNEMDLRKRVVDFAFDPEKKKGTENIELENGYKAKAVKKINYKVNQDTINSVLDRIENLGAEGKFIAERVIKWTADLSVSEYNDLDPKYKVILDEAITTTEGAPTLEIVAPKDKKRS